VWAHGAMVGNPIGTREVGKGRGHSETGDTEFQPLVRIARSLAPAPFGDPELWASRRRRRQACGSMRSAGPKGRLRDAARFLSAFCWPS